MDTFFHQSPVTINTQRNNSNVTNERQISSNILAETIKVFKRLTLQSTINDSAYYNSEEDVDERYPKIDPLIDTQTSDKNERKITDTDTTKGIDPHKLSTNREIPEIIQGLIPPVNQTTSDGVTTSRRDLHAVRTVLHKEIVTGATRSTAGVLKNPPVINYKDTSGKITVDRNTIGIPPRTTIQVWTGDVPSFLPISIVTQKIEGSRRSIITHGPLL